MFNYKRAEHQEIVKGKMKMWKTAQFIIDFVYHDIAEDSQAK